MCVGGGGGRYAKISSSYFFYFQYFNFYLMVGWVCLMYLVFLWETCQATFFSGGGGGDCKKKPRPPGADIKNYRHR